MSNYPEAAPMRPAATAPGIPKAAIWTGRVISVLVILFMIFDGVTKVLKIPQVLQASARLHLSVAQTVWIGIVLLVCTALYAIPRTAIFGAILLTGYLGGAVAVQLPARDPFFENAFPVIFGLFVWASLFLRDAQVRSIVPFRAQP